MTPMFSVVIPTYDRPELLGEAVTSVLSQTVSDLECLVIDDAGPTPVGVFDYPRVRVIRRESNGGEPAARNTGLRAARGRYLAFLDDDDVFAPERLQIALEGLKRAPVAFCWQSGPSDRPIGNRSLNGDVHDILLEGMTPQMGQVALQRAAAPQFDERFRALCDVDWLLRLTEKHEVATVPRAGLHYRNHAGVRHGNGAPERVRGSRLLMEKHAEYFARNPRARAFRWKRIGLMASRLGDHALARRSFLRSLSIRPEAATAWHLARAIRPSTRNIDLGGVGG
jgi:glycosyltransferase involved in cell wall biosynthesis